MDGRLYGTTGGGGTGSCYPQPSCGTAFAFDVGLGPVVNLLPNLFDFGAQGINRMNAPQTSTLTNTGGGSLLINNIGLGGANSVDFYEYDNCPIKPNPLAPGAHCNITVVFSPTGVGTRTANVTITDNAVDSPQMISLTGIGVGGKVALR
jgi:hypothetical protein